MAKPSKQQRRKQKKKRELKRRRARLAARAKASAEQNVDTLSAEPQREERWLEPAERVPGPPASLAAKPRDATPIDLWWEDFSHSDVDQRLFLVREKLDTVQPGDDWYDAIFPEATDELQSALSRERYVAFLEELDQTRPDVFALGLDWNTRTMAFEYVATDRLDELDDAVGRLADEIQKIDEPFFSLMSLVRLAGRTEVADRLIDAATSIRGESGLMPWAVDELITWAMFTPYQTCVQAGATDEAIEAAYQCGLSVGVEDSQQTFKNQRQIMLHWAGKSGKTWTPQELRTDGKKAGWRMYLLLVDYMRWLCESRGLAPIVADELRRILTEAVFHMEAKPKDLLGGLRRSVFEPVIARSFDFMSLNQVHAPATVIGMRCLYDFMAEIALVDERTQRAADSVCCELWNELQRVLDDQWRDYRFLERYWH